MGTPLEASPTRIAQQTIGSQGWTGWQAGRTNPALICKLNPAENYLRKNALAAQPDQSSRLPDPAQP